jgi:hypothetical protein
MLYTGKRARKNILAWLKKHSTAVAQHWEAVSAVVKTISDEVKAAKAEAEEKAKQQAEAVAKATEGLGKVLRYIGDSKSLL